MIKGEVHFERTRQLFININPHTFKGSWSQPYHHFLKFLSICLALSAPTPL